MSTRRIVLEPGDRQSVRARPLPGQKYTDLLPPIILDAGEAVVFSHSEAAPEPEPPPPDPEPLPEVDYSVTVALVAKQRADNDYIGINIPTADGSNTLHSQIAHKLHTDGSPHHHGSNYGLKPGASNGRLSHIDDNWSTRMGPSKPPPYRRIEETDVHCDGVILKASDGGRWLLYNDNGVLASRPA